ncbi:thiamine phosphate synthase [Streptomyces sp. CAU 1734]|uniref:thiamine phosphate synthase n=1 Tax=Streptomyces sp. CAU 1734 TaxID=3140360 RepID=UPI00325FFEBE
MPTSQEPQPGSRPETSGGSRPEPSGAPPAPRPSLAGARLYLCTDARKRRGDLAAFLDAVLSSGVDVVQLRDKSLEAAEELDHLAVLADACRRHGKLLAVNDRADIAHAIGSDVLHLGQGDLPVPAARAVLGAAPLIGRSTHSPAEAEAAAVQPGVDYFCTGPCWPTPTKPGRHAPGLELVRHTAALGTTRPWFAIGGIDARNLDEVLDAGARRIVVVRAITEAADPAAATAGLARRIRARSGDSDGA